MNLNEYFYFLLLSANKQRFPSLRRQLIHLFCVVVSDTGHRI